MTSILILRLGPKLKLIVLLFLMLAMNAADARALEGIPSCEDWFRGRWMEKQNGGTYAPIEANKYWLRQYLSDVAASSGIDFMFHSDTESFYRYVDKYCKKHPRDNLSDAGGALASELIDNKRL